MKKKMRYSFCSPVAPQGIWGCSGTVLGMFQEQKEQSRNARVVPLFLLGTARVLRLREQKEQPAASAGSV
jgi:hypothetical protein